LSSTGLFIKKQNTTGLHNERGRCPVEEGPKTSKSNGGICSPEMAVLVDLVRSPCHKLRVFVGLLGERAVPEFSDLGGHRGAKENGGLDLKKKKK